jgi:hypothetical protein
MEVFLLVPFVLSLVLGVVIVRIFWRAARRDREQERAEAAGEVGSDPSTRP